MPDRLRGTVASGTGDLARWMVVYADAYRDVTGVSLYPGSLNVELDREWRRPEPPPLRLEPDRVGVGVGLVPCAINGHQAFIVRTDRNEAGEGDHPRTVVEVVAEVHLRTCLNVADGDTVELLV